MNAHFQKVIAVLALSGMCLAQAAPTGSTSPKKKTSRPVAKKAPAATVEDIQQLREMLERQQQQIQQMQQQMAQRDQQLQQTQQQLADAQSAAKDAQAKVTQVEASANENKEGVAQVKNDVNDIRGNMTSQVVNAQDEQKRLSELAGLVGRFRFAGDVRVRYENFFQENAQDRNRFRYRLRFGVDGKLNEDFLAGIYIASGSLTDPTSTNQTMSNVFERTVVGFDRGYITYNPHYFRPLSVTGGKFAYTWIRTPMTFDTDLNPEGFSQKLSFDTKNKFIKNVSFVGVQLLYNESTSTTGLPGISPGADSYVVGGQVSSKLQLGSRWTMTPSYSILNWRNDNIILNEPASVTGGAPGVFAPNGMTNCTVTVGTVNAFCSKFLYSDFILNNTFKGPSARFPITVLGEYEVNLNAANNHSHAYYGGFDMGQTKNVNDIQFGYAWWRQEQDSVIASFNESDQRAPTNIVQNKFYFSWKLWKNTTLSYTEWIGRTLDPTLVNAKLAPGVSKTGVCGPGSPSNCLTSDPWLKRGQFDIVYTF